MNNEIKHYGTPRHSGRYPWGSGDDPQRSKDFLGFVEKLKNEGLSEKQIADGVGMTILQLRAQKSLAKENKKLADASMALRLKDKGYSNVAIGEKMGMNESSVRALLNKPSVERRKITENISTVLKEQVNDKKYIDIGVGVERHLGISRTKLNTVVEKLKSEEGYTTHFINVEQLGTGKLTRIKVLAKPDTDYREVYKNKENIKAIGVYSEDGGRSCLGLSQINNVNSKRVLIKYGDEGGSAKDGVVELRRGVDDISLGNSKYAQVRIGVDGTHYMKGMAMYSDDIPKGYDIIYNTNKAKGTPKEKVYKTMEEDEDNPFGATVRQKKYIDKNGKERLSALNIVNEEGDWSEWSKTISSQVLSKQSSTLAKKQLGLAFDAKKEEYDEIMSLTNPTVKKKLLEAFADGADSAAVHLKAAALPRQGSHVLLPFPDMKETEIYAPNYRDGESVVLIRYPHGGIFEIPELKVNNRHKGANKVIKNAKDAVGINHKVAERLSGADFDGDTVLVIPNNNKSVKNSAPLKGLLNFDPKISYPLPEDAPKLKSATKQKLMGDVSNLITDMTIKGANPTEIARAVRHSMVVIDAEKHHLNYKQSHIDNGIAQLKTKYQGGPKSGASTLISKASSEQRVDYRVSGKKVLDEVTGKTKRMYVDPKTGKKLYEYTGETYVDKKGNVQTKKIKSTKMYEVEDAFTLSSGTTIENAYATHANKLKALGNEARKEALRIKPTAYSPTAKKTYDAEVKSLNAKLNIALKNAPLERQAQIIANRVLAEKLEANPNVEDGRIKKLKGQALTEARRRVGATKQRIDIEPKEWEAIQVGAISTNKLSQIIDNTNLDKLKALATPRATQQLSTAKQTRIKSMLRLGYTQAEIADHLGVSTSLVSGLINL